MVRILVSDWKGIHTRRIMGQGLCHSSIKWGRAVRTYATVQTVALDRVNARYGAGTLALASSASAMAPVREAQLEAWQMQQARRSPRYTSEWNEFFTVR